MSKTIDEKVVEMRFDNKQFESNVRTTMSSLDKLKQSLKLDGASKGLENVNAAAKNVDMSGIGSAVETVRTKFSALEVMGVTALANITNSVVNTGKQLVKAFTIDPIKSGFEEYETQINAVQTILANTESKGSTLQDVNRALAELNTYADKTIYNFTEMTRNIGTFTAAGVDLKTSVSAIKGIANLAAVSGSTSLQASTAMYQLSQALAAGTVKLMDWNSVVNAGMGGQVFQDALKETARVHGIKIDEMIKKEGSFRETLQNGWLTSEILTETLNHFTMAAEEGTQEWENYKKSLMDTGYSEAQAEAILKMANTATDAATKVKTFTQLMDTLKESAQSGWTKSWEIMIGDFEEAKYFLTDVSDKFGAMIGESADARNKMLSGGLSSGWKQLLEAGIADEEGYKEMLKSVAKEHGVSIDDMIAAEKKLDDSLSDREAFQKALKTGFKDGKISANTLTKSVYKMADKMSNMSAKQLEAAGYTQEHIKQIKDLSAGLKDGSISMDDFVKKINRTSGRENIIQALWNAFDGLMSVINPIKEAFRDIFPATTGEQVYQLTERILEFSAKLKLSDEQSANLKSTFKGLFSIMKIGVTAIKAVIGGIANLIGKITGLSGGILGITGSLGVWVSEMAKTITETNLFGKAVNKIVSFLGIVIDKFKEFGSSIKDSFGGSSYSGISGFLTGLWKIIEKVGSGIIAGLSTITDGIVKAFGGTDVLEVINNGLMTGILAYIVKFIKGLSGSFDEVSGVLENITGILDDVRGCFEAYQNNLKADTLIKIAKAIGILALSLFLISTIDGDALGRSLAGITVLFGEISGFLMLFSKLSLELTGVSKAIPLMFGVSVAILILAAAMKKLSSLDWNGIAKGLAGVAGLLFELSIFLRTYKFDGKMTGTAFGILILSAALLVLSKAVKNFGAMKWEEIGKGLAAIAGLLTELAIFVKLTGNSKNVISTALAMILLGGAMKTFASAMKDFGSMKWEEIGKGLTAMAGALAEIIIAMRLMPKGGMVNAVGLVVAAAALEILADVLSNLGGMSWSDIGKGLTVLGGALIELSIALKLMSGSIAGSMALIIAAGALAIMTPVLKSLGNMSWGQIVKGLVALAGAFLVIGVAGALLKPLIPTILGLAGSIALFGLSILSIGAGLTLMGLGLAAIAAGFTALAGAVATGASAIVAGLTVIITGFIKLIPRIAVAIAQGLVEIIKVLAESVGDIVGSLLKLVQGVLSSLATYTPQIVESLMVFLIGVINAVAEHLPELIKAAVNLVGKFFQGVVDALKGINADTIFTGIEIVGLLSALMFALSAVASLIPSAMVGVLGIGLVIAEFAGVLAIIGGLAQIPGLKWLISEGGDFLQEIGTAIGKFVGGIAGGFATGLTNSFPEIASDLSEFMINLKPFIDGAKTFDASTLTGVKSLVGVVSALASANLKEKLSSWLTGGSSLAQFGKELAEFGPSMKQYSDSVKGMDPSAVSASVIAAKSLTALTENLPKSGGLSGWIFGNSDLGTFATQLVSFGEALSGYSKSIKDINPEAVTASAAAAKALAEMTHSIPNEGGLLAWITGDNSVAKFGFDLKKLGKGLKNYSDEIDGINPAAITASAAAAKALAEMTSIIPNEGGLVAWITGDNSVAKFGFDLGKLGKGLKNYSDSIDGIKPAAITASAAAAKALAEMTSTIPNTGGVVAWFTGDNSISKFGTELASLGDGLSAFSESVAGINTENIVLAANAAKALAEMTAIIPNEGGVVAWFAGDNSISSFANQLPTLGDGLLGFSTSVTGINAENILAAANAAKALAELTQVIPNEGGSKAWFSGESGVATFSDQLPTLGDGLLKFSTSVTGINAEGIVAASQAAKALAEMVEYIPNKGGIKAWFSGENGVATFSDQLPTLGDGLSAFSESVAGINAENITSAASAAKALAEMTKYIPNEGGIKAWFSGESGVATFADGIPSVGKAIKAFDTAVKEITPENITAASSAAKTLAEMTKTVPENTDKLLPFGTNLVSFSDDLKTYFAAVSTVSAEAITAANNVSTSLSTFGSNINPDQISAASKAIKEMVKAINKASSVKEGATNGFIVTMTTLGSVSAESIVKSFTDSNEKMKKAGEKLIAKVAEGIKAKKDSPSKAAKEVAKSSGEAAGDQTSAFKKAGENLVKGFANGITENTYRAKASAKAMAAAAAEAAKKELDEHSPSKVGYQIGDYFGIAFVNAIGDNESKAYSAGKGMAESAKTGLSKAISRVTDVINSDVDTQPTIRPIVDLSNVESGANAINGMLNMQSSIGVLSNVNSINRMMNRRQTGVTNSDVVSAIKDLGQKVGNAPTNTYNINGITYDNGSEVANAIEVLARAAIIERRT